MNKQEFIDKLRMSLNSQLAPAQVAEHIRYYEDYINMEIRKGRAEGDVMQSLGDPRLIARSIVDVTDMEDSQQSYGGNESGYSYYQYSQNGSNGAYGAGAGMGGNAAYRNAGGSYSNAYGRANQQEINESATIWNKRLGRFTLSKWLWIILGILIIFLIISAIFSLVSFLMPLLVPIFIVVFITKLFRDWLK